MATLVELILACSLSTSPVVQDTLYRVIMGHAGGHTLTVHDVHSQKNYTVKSNERAAALADGLLQAGHDVRLGMVALPHAHVTQTLELDVARAMDACTQIKLSSELLEDAIKLEGSRRESQLHRALARYYMPGDSESLEAIDWGARILMVERVDIQKAHDTRQIVPGGVYTLTRSAFLGADSRPRRASHTPSGSAMLFVSTRSDDKKDSHSQPASPQEHPPKEEPVKTQSTEEIPQERRPAWWQWKKRRAYDRRQQTGVRTPEKEEPPLNGDRTTTP